MVLEEPATWSCRPPLSCEKAFGYLLPKHPSFGGSAFSGKSQCNADFTERPCDEVMRAIGDGTAGVCPSNYCGAVFNPDRDGRGRGGWQRPYLTAGGFIDDYVGPSTRPKGPPPTLGQDTRTEEEKKRDREKNKGKDKTGGRTDNGEDDDSLESDLRAFLFDHPQCSSLLKSLLDVKWVSGDEVGGVFDQFSFVDVRKHPELMNKTLNDLGLPGSTLTLGEAMTNAIGYTIIETGTIYFKGSPLQNTEDRGLTLFHESLVHAAYRSPGHAEVADALGINYTKPPHPKPPMSISERFRYDLMVDTEASFAIDKWISGGCK